MGTRGSLNLCSPQKPTLRHGPRCRWFIWEVIPEAGVREGRGKQEQEKSKEGDAGKKAIAMGNWHSILWGPLWNPVEQASGLDLQGTGKLEHLSTDSPNYL